MLVSESLCKLVVRMSPDCFPKMKPWLPITMDDLVDHATLHIGVPCHSQPHFARPKQQLERQGGCARASAQLQD